MGIRQPECFLARQASREALRFITCGSVDDGKSTLIGRLLHESRQIFDDQIVSLQADSRRHGTQGDAIDYALLVDGLQAEREQGITIDVAYRYMATGNRRFIIADTPGHRQYTRNMVTAASTAQLAVLLVDARHGILEQTRRHAAIVAMLGIRHVVLAINKMDQCHYSQSAYQDIAHAFQAFAQPFGFVGLTMIPMSALLGDNITTRSTQMPWYGGPVLVEHLETVDVAEPEANGFLFPIQAVLRPNADFRGFAGTLAAGKLKIGDAVRVAGSGACSHIASLHLGDANLASARAGQAITVTLADEIDLSRGELLCPPDDPVASTDRFEADVVWMNDQPATCGQTWELRLGTASVPARLERITYRIDMDTMARVAADQLALNDIGSCHFILSRATACTAFGKNSTMGGFILIDRITHATVGAGMIRRSLQAAPNIHPHAMSITRADRERLNGHRGRVIWLTGLPGSGKSTLANALEIVLHRQGLRTLVLDGDNIRHGLSRDLGFSEADRAENIRRVAELSKLLAQAGQIVITAFISPFERERQMARELIGGEDFVEVFIDTPLSVCEARDPKGLYRLARAGRIPDLSGVGSRYERPASSELVLATENRSVGECVDEILSHLGGTARIASPEQGKHKTL